MISTLDKEWQVWLDENLARPCDPLELYDIMRSAGFSNSTLQAVMGNAYPPQYKDAPYPASIDYQALSQRMERPEMQGIAQRFPSDEVQLYTIDNFLTEAECQQLIEHGRERLTPSQTTHSNGDPYFRTSMTCHLEMHTYPFIKAIDEKISRALGIRWPYSEPIQMQAYQVGQELKAHHDYFPLNSDIYPKVAGKAGQRTWTFAVYLNEVEQGGGTYFPYLDHTIYPKTGRAAIWNNLAADGVINRQTLHCGMPVESGEKFIITKWFREHGFGSVFI